MKKLVFIDFDGTIYNNKNDFILPSTIDAIKTLSKKEDIILGLATGRSIDTLTKIKDLLNLFEIKILINGSLAYYRDEIIYSNPINKNISNELIDFLINNNINYAMITNQTTIISRKDEKMINALKEFGLPLPDFYSENTNDDVYQFWVFDGKYSSNDLSKKFTSLQFINWNFEGMDVLDLKSSKKDGIIAAKKIFKDYSVYVFGDGLNDIEMFKEADYSCAMGQAKEEVKKHATYVTDRIENDGLVKGLKYYNLI
jgi:Cof subfamily protein (haloacid dehalogenase superfamily)